MKKTIDLDGQEVTYLFRKGGRGLRMSINADGELRVAASRYYPQFAIDAFLRSRASWILAAIRRMKSRPKSMMRRASRKKFLKHKEAARTIARERLEHFNKHYGLKYGRIAIRNQKTRWGSCSKTGNLNFNYQIALLPPELADYIVVHELCHIGQFNHSKKFWDLVAETVPNWKQLRSRLKGGRLSLS